MQTQFPDLTPYQFSGNTPIQAVDLDGLEPQGFMSYWESRTDPYMTKWNYTVQDFYDYETERVWTVMNYPNTNEYYYWESKYENAVGLFKPLNTSLNKVDGKWTGLFREFKPKLLSQDRSLHYGMLTMLASPFVALGIIEGGVAVLAVAQRQVLNAIAKGILAYYKYGPMVGGAGRLVAEFADESGAVGVQNAAVKNVALGLKGNLKKFANSFENTFAAEDWRKLGVTGGTAENFVDEFYEAVNAAINSGGKIRFDISGLDIKKALKAAGKGLYEEGVGYTDWEFNQILSNEYLKKATEFFEDGKKIDIDEKIKKLNQNE